jgi:hypothetical protein
MRFSSPCFVLTFFDRISTVYFSSNRHVVVYIGTSLPRVLRRSHTDQKPRRAGSIFCIRVVLPRPESICGARLSISHRTIPRHSRQYPLRSLVSFGTIDVVRIHAPCSLPGSRVHFENTWPCSLSVKHRNTSPPSSTPGRTRTWSNQPVLASV